MRIHAKNSNTLASILILRQHSELKTPTFRFITYPDPNPPPNSSPACSILPAEQ